MSSRLNTKYERRKQKVNKNTILYGSNKQAIEAKAVKHKPNLGKVKRCIYLAFFVAIVTPGRSVRVCVVSNCLEGKMQKEMCSLPGFCGVNIYRSNEAL